MSIPISVGIVFVRYYGGTYIARFQGKCGTEYVWQITEES
jgi:hypothetical protein